MGKARRKNKGPRADPMGMNGDGSHRETEETMMRRKEEDIISNIIEQLQSSNPEDKVCGCQSLGNLSSMEVVHQLILSQRLVRSVAPLFLEKDPMVQLSALGALRNISGLNPETAEEMVNQDVMTPLETFLSAFRSKSLDSFSETDFKLINEAFSLLWNLIEVSPKASNLLSSSDLVVFCTSFLTHDSRPDLVNTVLHLLASAADQNKHVSSQILPVQGLIEKFLDHPNPSLRMASVVVLTSLLDEAILESSCSAKVLQILSASIKSDFRKEICNVSSNVPVNEESDDNMEMDSDVDSAEKELLESLRNQQTALEILANLCSGDDDSDGWEDESDDDEVDDIDADDNSDAVNEGVVNVLNVNPVVTEVITRDSLVTAVLEKANQLPQNVSDILRSSRKGKKLLSVYTTIRARSFLCLSNMLEILSVDDFGGAASLFSTWNSLGTQLVQEKDEELLEASSSCMRSVTAKLCQDEQGKSVMNMTQKELEAIVVVGQECGVPEVRMNIVNIIGDISSLLAKTLPSGGAVDVFKILVTWLVEGGCKDSDLRVVTESLDKLFDAFSEDYTDNIFFQDLNLLPKFKGIENGFKVKLKMQKRELSADSLGIINMAKINLRRFIKYKEKRCKTEP